MKSTKGFVLGMAAIGLLVASVFTPTSAGAQSPPPPGQVLRRLAANFTAFDDTQIFVNKDATAGGLEIYDQTVKSPAGANVLYVTVQGTKIAFTGAETGVAMNCVVDGVACNSGSGADQDLDDLPSGWIEVAGDATDEDVIESFLTDSWMTMSYTWCVPIAKTKKNLHTVELFAAEDEDEDGTEGVLLQTVSFYVDSSKFSKANIDLGNGCAAVPNANPTDAF